MEIIKDISYSIFYIIINYGVLIAYGINVPRILHYMQLSGYSNSDFIRWFTKNPKIAFKSGFSQFVAIIIIYIVFAIINTFAVAKLNSEQAIIVLAIEYLTLLMAFILENVLKAIKEKKERKSAKKKLVYTARAKRLVFWNVFTALLLEISFFGSFGGIQPERTLGYSFLILVLPINMIIANFFAYPTEKLIGDWYISLAKLKLRKKSYKNLIKIGITGSYRKNEY